MKAEEVKITNKVLDNPSINDFIQGILSEEEQKILERIENTFLPFGFFIDQKMKGSDGEYSGTYYVQYSAVNACGFGDSTVLVRHSGGIGLELDLKSPILAEAVANLINYNAMRALKGTLGKPVSETVSFFDPNRNTTGE